MVPVKENERFLVNDNKECVNKFPGKKEES